jgi:hypothetical protein
VLNNESYASNELFPVTDEPDLVPLASLSPSERHQLRIERDRILDLLEEEERQERLRDKEMEREQMEEDIRKRQVSVKFEIEKLKAAKEMQKKMGKALLKAMEKDRSNEGNALDTASAQGVKKAPPKKTVTFADDEDNGDVSLAKLGPSNQNTLINKAKMEKHQVLRDVVERLPPGADSRESYVDPGDSDDDTDPHSDPDDGNAILPNCDSEDGSSNSTDDHESDSHMPEEEYDLDDAHHQREIALEYYKKRETVGGDISEALASHIEAQNNWDQPVRIFRLPT